MVKYNRIPLTNRTNRSAQMLAAIRTDTKQMRSIKTPLKIEIIGAITITSRQNSPPTSYAVEPSQHTNTPIHPTLTSLVFLKWDMAGESTLVDSGQQIPAHKSNRNSNQKNVLFSVEFQVFRVFQIFGPSALAHTRAEIPKWILHYSLYLLRRNIGWPFCVCLCCVCVLGQNTISYQFINLIVSQFDVIFSHKFLRFLFVFSSHSVTLCCVSKAASCHERRRFGWMWGTESST